MLFKTCGVCSSAIEFDVKDNKITDVHLSEAAPEILRA